MYFTENTIPSIKVWLTDSHKDAIVSGNCRLTLTVGCFVILTFPTWPTSHTRSGVVVGSDTQ